MLKERSSEQEIMDDLDISGPVVSQTLRELNTINRTLGGNQISISAFDKVTTGLDQFVLVDLGCGGGDIMVGMAKRARKHNKKGSFVGIDANPNIVEYAKKNTAAYPEVTYQSKNIFSEEFRKMKFDLIHCCLFLHHFTNEQLIELFQQFKTQANVGIIINDLHRHPLAYWSIKVLTFLFSKSSMVRNDAAVSVARGFKKTELLMILKEAGITHFELKWKWAFRWQLTF